eukprot:comp16444_c0_seq1/m.14387 comp16444_c0_seq1/g.14387  ORF comp16444_c0_seq1/g.14387 comp16444_c0_seq1/m.14387 type:complete len:230 (-) comp16444_c0_seq1:214-903(-)
MARTGESSVARLQQLIDGLQHDLDERDRLEDNNHSGQRPGRAARRKLADAKAGVEDLEDMVTGRGARGLEASEKRQRQGVVAEARERLGLLEERCNDGPQYPELDREELLQGQGQGWGLDDDEATTLEVDEILERQRQTMAEQDRGLDSLAQAIGRQRAVGVAIFDEVDEQNMLLDELDDHMDATSSRVHASTNRVRQLLDSDASKKGCALLVALVVALGVLIVLVFVF